MRTIKKESKITEPAISIKIKGKKYGARWKQETSEGIGEPGRCRCGNNRAKNHGTESIDKKAVLMRRSMPMGILTALKITRRATISAAKIRLRVFLNSEKPASSMPLKMDEEKGWGNEELYQT